MRYKKIQSIFSSFLFSLFLKNKNFFRLYLHIIFRKNGPCELCAGLTYFGFCDNIRQAFGREGEIPVLYFRRIMSREEVPAF